MNYSAFVDSRFKDGSQILANANAVAFGLLHAAVGIAGEVYEYEASTTRENAIEELGDIAFYVTAAHALCGGVGSIEYSPNHLGKPPKDNAQHISDMYVIAFELLDMAKKAAFYNKLDIVSDERTRGALRAFLVALDINVQKLCTYHGITYADLLAENYRKLTKRYPDGYNDKAAQDRADKAN